MLFNIDNIAELETKIYLMVANELRVAGIHPLIGRMLMSSVCRKFDEDAVALVSSRNSSLEKELANKMKEIEELKAKIGNESVGKESVS